MRSRFQDGTVAGWLCALCFLGLAWLFWPGIMPLDSFRQYSQSIHHDFNTWHPVFMAVLWSKLNLVYSGPQLFFILNLSLYISALFLIAQASIRHGLPHSWMICFSGFLPFLSNFTGALIKDTILCNTWLFGYALLFRAHLSGVRPGLPAACLSLAALTCGFLVRPFSAPALLPLLGFGCYVFREEAWCFRTLVRSTLLVYVGICLMAPITDSVVKARPNSFVPQLFLWDLAGTSLHAGVDLFPEYLRERPEHNLAIVKLHYSAVTSPTLLHLGWGQETRRTPEQVYRGPIFVSYIAHDMQQHQPELLIAWFNALRKHPVAYLEHRLAVARSLLRFGYDRSYEHAYYDHWQPDYPEPSVPRRDPAQVLAMRLWIESAVRMVPALFKPWLWLALNGLALLLSYAYRGDARIRLAALTLASSAILYIAPLLLFTPSSDFRYVYWAVWATSLSLGLLILDMWRHGSAGVGRDCIWAAVLIACLVPTEFLYRKSGPLAMVPWLAGIVFLCLGLLTRRAPRLIR